MSEDSIQHLLAALEDPAHLETFTRTIRAQTKADAVLLRIVNYNTWRFPVSAVCGNPPFTPAFFKVYDVDYASRDPQTRIAERKMLPRGHVYLCHEHYDEAARKRDPYFVFLATHDIQWTAAYMAQVSDCEAVAVCAVRLKGRPPFDEEAREHLRPVALLLGAWGKALCAARRNAAAMRAAQLALRLGATRAICIDDERRPAWIERAPADLEQVGLEVFNGRLRGITPLMERLLGEALTSVLRSPDVGPVKLATPAGPALLVHGDAGGGFAVLTWTPAARGQSASPASLTKAEQATVDLLRDGLSLEKVAARRGVELSTQRTQLKRIYRKYGVNSLPQLLARIMRAA